MHLVGQISMQFNSEWHTHPEIVPNPSTIDLNEWEILANKCPLSGGMGMVIVGIQDLWCGIAKKDSLRKMDKIF